MGSPEFTERLLLRSSAETPDAARLKRLQGAVTDTMWGRKLAVAGTDADANVTPGRARVKGLGNCLIDDFQSIDESEIRVGHQREHELSLVIWLKAFEGLD